MNNDEQVAYNFLKMKFHGGHVVYEPDGNIPPDFLVNSSIAVEVRRLNINDLCPDGAIAIEEQSISLKESIDKLLKKFPNLSNEKSWFVIFDFSHPIRPWKDERQNIMHALTNFLNGPKDQLCTWVGRNRLTFIESPSPQETRFSNGGVDVDDPRSGWLIPDLKSNIEYCAKYKLKKICDYHGRYNKWWLILVDHISFSELMESDACKLLSCLALPQAWEKVILVNPLAPNESIEL